MKASLGFMRAATLMRAVKVGSLLHSFRSQVNPAKRLRLPSSLFFATATKSAKKASPEVSGEQIRRVAQLRNDLERYNAAYYAGKPLVSDAQYDHLFRELQILEQLHPHLLSRSSPTQRVGTQAITGIRHQFPMISLENIFSLAELQAFVSGIEKRLTTAGAADLLLYGFVIERKYDGMAVSLLYENGRFVRAVSRGDGAAGDDISANVLKLCPGLPRALSRRTASSGDQIPLNMLDKFEVRGEIVMSKSEFQAFNRRQQAREESGFHTARNLTAGLLRRLPSDHGTILRVSVPQNALTLCDAVMPDTDAPKLSIRCYSLHLSDDRSERNLFSALHLHRLHELQRWGFETDTEAMSHVKVTDIQFTIDKAMGSRDRFPFDTDGFVIKLNSLLGQKLLGSTSRAPRWAVAYKFHAQHGETILKEIVAQVGRTGRATPVGILEPVTVGGVTISRATLHNFAAVSESGLQPGDRVVVERRGDVIPYIRLPQPSNSLPVSAKECTYYCPCEQKVQLTAKHGEVNLFCPSTSCPEQQLHRVLYFASRDAANITGLGISTAELLIRLKLVTDVSDIFRLSLHATMLTQEPRWGIRKVSSLLQEIERCRESATPAQILIGLGIPRVGPTMAALLLRSFGSIEQLVHVRQDQLMEIEQIGPVAASEISRWFASGGADLVRKLAEVGVKAVGANVRVESHDSLPISLPQTSSSSTTVSPAAPTSPLRGKVLVFTGSLTDMSRPQAKRLVTQMGGSVKDSLTKDVDYLVVGGHDADPQSRKYIDAKRLDIKVLSEPEFKALLGAKAS